MQRGIITYRQILAACNQNQRATASIRRRFLSTEKADGDQQPPPSQTPETAEHVTEAEPLSETDKLTKQLEEKNAQIADLNDRTLRILAEMENVRMIARRDVENARKYSIVPFAKALLSVADNLGLALNAVPAEVVTGDDAHPQLKGLFHGVEATEAELLKVFSQHGITRFGDVGDKFDPNRYQAMFEAPVEGAEPGSVIDVTKLGYAIGDRILRPAEVGVCTTPRG